MNSRFFRRNELLRWLRSAVLFPFLLPVFFVLHTERYYTGAVPAKDAAELIITYVLGGLLVYALLRFFVKMRAVAGIITFFLLVLFLYWWEIIPAIINTFHFSQNYRNHPFYLLTCLLIVCSIAWLLSRQKEPTHERIVFFMNALLLIYTTLEIGLLTFYALSGRMHHPVIDNKVARMEDASVPHAGKDIYFLLFDEYASNTSLKNDWHLDNSEMTNYLTSKGFLVPANTHSNYNLTQFSMTSILNMAYLKGHTDSVSTVGDRDYQYCVPELQYARVPEVLKRAGYTFNAYSIFDIEDQPGYELNSRLLFKQKLVTNHTFFQIATDFYLPYLVARKELRRNPAYYDSAFYQVNTYNQYTLRRVLNIAGKKAASPQFVYAHFLLPHPPFYYDSLGRLLSIPALDSNNGQASYATNVQQANRFIRLMADRILSKSNGQAAMIIMGDHGYRANYKTNHTQSFPAFSALYFPDRDYSTVPAQLTYVNLFRIVLNKFCGMHYKLLPDRQCFLKEI